MKRKHFFRLIISLYTLAIFYFLIHMDVIDNRVAFGRSLIILIFSFLPALSVLVYTRKLPLYDKKEIKLPNGLILSGAFLVLLSLALLILTFFEMDYEKQIDYNRTELVPVTETIHMVAMFAAVVISFLITGLLDGIKLKDKWDRAVWRSLILYLFFGFYVFAALVFIYVKI